MIEMEEAAEEEDNAILGFYNMDRPHFQPDSEAVHFNSNTNFAANLIFADYFGLSCFVA